MDLTPWANWLALRFGRPVYLVGSALNLSSPRDVDIRVILTDAEFNARYGDPSDWNFRLWTDPSALIRYGADLYDLSREASFTFKANLDIQVQPENAASPEEPRYRLDTIEAILPVPSYRVVPLHHPKPRRYPLHGNLRGRCS